MEIKSTNGLFVRELPPHVEAELFSEFIHRIIEKTSSNESTTNVEGEPRKVESARHGSTSKFVIGKCECGKHFYVNIHNPNEKDLFTFVCTRCEKQTLIRTASLVPTGYNCPKCRTKSTFWATPSAKMDVRCKKCHHTMELEYDVQTKAFKQK